MHFLLCRFFLSKIFVYFLVMFLFYLEKHLDYSHSQLNICGMK